MKKANPTSLQLPGPRIWTAKDLADFFGMTVFWVYKRTKEKAGDPPPRCPGIGRLRFDTHSEAFRQWMSRQLGWIETGEDDA